MRILVVHNTYQKFGGEDAVFRNEVALLKKAGIEVDKRACELGERAYEEFQEKYTEEASLDALVSIYESVIRDKASGCI